MITTVTEAEQALKDILLKAEEIGRFARERKKNMTSVFIIADVDNEKGNVANGIGYCGTEEDVVAGIVKAMIDNPTVRDTVLLAARGYNMLGPKSGNECNCPLL